MTLSLKLLHPFEIQTYNVLGFSYVLTEWVEYLLVIVVFRSTAVHVKLGHGLI